MRLIQTVIILIGLFLGTFSFGATPNGYVEFIDLEQNYNVFGRKSEVLSELESLERSLYGIYIPVEQLTVVRSKAWREDPWAEVLGDQRLSLPLFVRDDQGDKMNLIKLSHSQALSFRDQSALRLQGKSSFLSWCSSCNRPMTFLKIQTQWGRKQKNTAYHGQLAVRVNDVIESLMEDSSESRVDFFPERFSVSYQDTNVEHAYSVRSLETKFQSKLELENEIMLPVHGILRDEFFQNRGWNMESWVLEQYIPKLAKMNAYLQFEKGIYLEGHTQNLVVFVDKTTGAINRMAFRDIADIMIDPFIGLARGETHHYESLKETAEPCLIYQQTYEDPGVPGPRAYYEWYMTQGITTSTQNWFKKRKIAKKYLKEFFQEYERLTGEKVPRSVRLRAKEGFALQYLGSESISSILGKSAEALQKIHFKKMWKSYFRPENFEEIPVNEKSVKLINGLLNANSIVFFEKNSLSKIKALGKKSRFKGVLGSLVSIFIKEKPRVFFDGSQVLIQNSGGRPLGLAYMLSEEQKQSFRILGTGDLFLDSTPGQTLQSLLPNNRYSCETSFLSR